MKKNRILIVCILVFCVAFCFVSCEDDGIKMGDEISQNTGTLGDEGTGDNVGSNTGNSTGDNTGNNSGDNSGDTTSDSTGNNSGDNSGDNSGSTGSGIIDAGGNFEDGWNGMIKPNRPR